MSKSRVRIVVCLLLSAVVAACSSASESAVPEAVAAPATVDETSEQDANAAEPSEFEPAPTATEPELDEGLKLLAHRGVHQTYNTDGLDDQTCTATRMDHHVHDYIENTLPSIEAAFAAGAGVVEIDIAPTADGVLAVFHDWEVGCRTNSSGDIRSFSWDELSNLDIGYGYTADGETYPLRGKGQGLMPRLEDVFAAFPEGQFLINFKSNDVAEAALLQAVVEAEDAADQVWAVYGRRADGVVDAYVAATKTRGFTLDSVAACLGEYIAAADSDLLLAACKDTVVIVPLDVAPILAGWPDAFIQRMERHGTDVIVSGPGLAHLTGIDSKAELDLLPPELNVYVWTNKIEALT